MFIVSFGSCGAGLAHIRGEKEKMNFTELFFLQGGWIEIY